MLPPVTLTRLRRGAIAGAAALSMAIAGAAPAQATHKNQRALLGVLAGAAIVGILANDARQKRAQPRYVEEPRYPAPQPQYFAPRYDDDARYDDRRRYDDDRYGDRRYDDRRYDDRRYDDRRYEAPRYQPVPQYASPVTDAFREYSVASRRAIQTRLRAYGYYRGAIDGIYGPGTRNAIEAYARDTGNSGLLGTRNGTVTLLNGLLA